MTIPLKKIPDLPKDLFAGVADGVVVIDTANYYPQPARREDRARSRGA